MESDTALSQFWHLVRSKFPKIWNANTFDNATDIVNATDIDDATDISVPCATNSKSGSDIAIGTNLEEPTDIISVPCATDIISLPCATTSETGTDIECAKNLQSDEDQYERHKPLKKKRCLKTAMDWESLPSPASKKRKLADNELVDAANDQDDTDSDNESIDWEETGVVPF